MTDPTLYDRVAEYVNSMLASYPDLAYYIDHDDLPPAIFPDQPHARLLARPMFFIGMLRLKQELEREKGVP